MAWSRSHHQWVTKVQPNMNLHLQSHYFYLRCSNNYDSHKQNFQEQYWYFSKWIQRGNGWLSSHPSILFPSLNSPVILYGSHHRRTFISIILSQTHKKSSQKEQQPRLSKIFKWWFFLSVELQVARTELLFDEILLISKMSFTEYYKHLCSHQPELVINAVYFKPF